MEKNSQKQQETDIQAATDSALRQQIDNVFAAIIQLGASKKREKELDEIKSKSVLSNSDFATLFMINRRSSYTWRKRDHIPYLKLGRRVYFLWSAVLPILESKLIKD